MGYPESAQPTALPLPNYIQSTFFTGLETPLTASFGQDHCGKSSEFVNTLTEQ